MNEAAPSRGLTALLLVSSALWMAQSYWEEVDLGQLDAKLALRERVLANTAPAPYQYKLWLPEQAFGAVARATGAPIGDVYLGNTVLALLVLVLAHRAWLAALLGPRAALLGVLLLPALAHCLFRIHYHHPYEFWGVAAWCLLLRGLVRGASVPALALGLLATGLVWEKQVLLAPAWGLLALRAGRPFPGALARGLLLLAAALAVPVALRLALDHGLSAPRPDVDGDVPLARQAWHKVLWYQGPYVLPFVLLLAAGWRHVPAVVRVLWLALPVMALAYALKHYNLHEARSFWALAPVFTATACAVILPAPAPATPPGPPAPPPAR